MFKLGFEIQILKSLAGIYTWIWINIMFSFFNLFAFDLIEQVRVMVSSFNYYDPIHLTIKRWVIGLILGASMDLFFRVLLTCTLRVYINKLFLKNLWKNKLINYFDSFLQFFIETFQKWIVNVCF